MSPAFNSEQQLDCQFSDLGSYFDQIGAISDLGPLLASRYKEPLEKSKTLSL